MQTPTKPKVGTLEVPQRTSPSTPNKTARKLKTLQGSGSDSPHQASRAPKDQSPKVVTERRSPRSPVTEKKRPSKVSQLESQLAQLQDDLKKAKDQLISSESCKKRIELEAEDAKKQLSAISAKLEEANRQLTEISASEEARVQELSQIPHDQDEVWLSELEAAQKQQSLDSTALASAMDEIKKLKIQLETEDHAKVVDSKHADDEILVLQEQLRESSIITEKLQKELSDCKETKVRTEEDLGNTKMHLETVMETADALKLEALKTREAHDSLVFELEQSKSQVKSLEEQVSKLQEDLQTSRVHSSTNSGHLPEVGEVPYQKEDNAETKQLKSEVSNLNIEVTQLRAALAAAEMTYQEECMQNTSKITSAYEQVERTKMDSSVREAELEAELNIAKSNVDGLTAKLVDQEGMLHSVSQENERLKSKSETNQMSDKECELQMDLKKLEVDLANLKSSLLDKETELQSFMVQNEMLKREMQKRELERTKENNDATALVEVARAAEREALMKVGYITEEADKNSRRAARVMEQLDAAQAASSEMEAELRRLKVQSDQWRKAAEAAAAMLSTDNGKYMDRTRSLDSNYHTIGGKMNSPYSDDMEDESPKKKNGNMLRKIGVLWKKGQNQK